MIFYFSGTGNSKWVAQEIAQRTGDQAVDIAALRKIQAPIYEPTEGETIGFVFPIHAWRAPKYMIDFALEIQCHDSNYLFGVATCGEDAGNGLKLFAEAIPLSGQFTIQMPNNYIKSYPVDAPEKIKRCVDQAKIQLPEICKAIQERQSTVKVHKGKFAGMKTGLIGGAFSAFALSTRGFSVEDTCNGCGLCVTICPMNTISLKEGKPVWDKQCTQCAGCINRCPESAIQDGKSKENGRYYFERDGAVYR